MRRYGVAAVSVIIATLVCYLLNPALGEYATFSFFVPAILISSWYGGLLPGLFASILSLIIADYLFVEPILDVSRFGRHHFAAGFVYLFSSFIVVGLVNALRHRHQEIETESHQNLERAELLQREIARREKAEHLLRDREEHLRLIFENARGMAIISFDNRGHIDDWNDAAEKIFGYSKSEILGRHCSEIFTPEDCAFDRPEIEFKEARENKPTGDDCWQLAKGGRRVFLNGITCAKFNASHEVIGYLKVAFDNTEREKTREALRQSEWRFRKIYESAAVGIVEVDVSGHFLSANEKFCHTVGYTLEELRGKTFFDITHPEDRADNAKAFRNFVAGTVPVYEAEKRCICKNGNVIWSQLTASFLRDELGNPIKSIAVIADITERKLSERKLRESGERLRLATDSGEIGLWHWDLTTGKQEWSPIARQHLGQFADTESSLENFRRSLHGDDYERVKRLCNNCIRDRTFLDVEYRVIWPDKSLHWIWAKGRFLPEREEGGNVFIGVTMDITERKRAAEELQRAASLFSTILESTDDGILVVDLEGKVVAHNEKFGRMWRIPVSLLERKDNQALLAWVVEQLREPDLFIGKVNELIKSEIEDRDELEFKDGRVFDRFSQPHRINGKIVGRVWSFKDMTDLHLARKAILAHSQELERRVADRTQELEKALRDMETFLYAIAHDLRAPLRAMSSFINLLTEDFATHLDATAQDYCKRIHESSVRMNQLITDILSYGRLTHMSLRTHAVDLGTEVEKALMRASFEIEERHGSVQVDRPLPKVFAEASVLDQIIENLILNAIKFVPKERTPRLHIYAEEHENNIRLCLEDNGIGIAPENQSKIFGPFQRLHTVDEYPGTGIGLAIVQRGVEKMGGHVGVESTIGQGSRFWVELPKDGHDK